jgi:NAD-dependent SIR2 family protein deacetylase
MYDTLRPDLLTATESQRRRMREEPTTVVSWDLFKENPFPYLEVRRPFILGTRDGRWRATIAHRFFELLHERTGKLTRLYTQNIDGLEAQCAGLPPELVVAVHGTLSEAGCEGCGRPVDDYRDFCGRVERQIKDIYHDANQMEQQQQQQDEEGDREELQVASGDTNDDSSPPRPQQHHHPTESTPILCAGCGAALVKPSTVLYGRALPAAFWDHAEGDARSCDLLFVAGTSLEVAPANQLVRMVPGGCVRVVVNLERVGMGLGIDYGTSDPNSRDCFARGETDEVFLALIQELGWMDGLASKRDLLPESSRRLVEREIAAGEGAPRPGA